MQQAEDIFSGNSIDALPKLEYKIQNDEKKSPAKTKTVVKEKKAADSPAKIKAKKEEKNGK